MKKPLLLRLVEGLRRRATPAAAAPAAPKPLPEILFTPVIFANGRDDDSEGVKAFFEHRPVFLDGRLIGPEDAAACLRGLVLRFSHGRIVCRVNGVVVQIVGYAIGSELRIDVPLQSRRNADCCDMRFNAPVQP